MSVSQKPVCLGMKGLPPEALQQVAAYFQTLSEPTRLQLLNFLREGERNVGELAELCGYTAANVSSHLGLLQRHARHADDPVTSASFSDEADTWIERLAATENDADHMMRLLCFH